ncbi:DUF3015 family protein [Deltaproteobacteria bacterium TL4]
MMKKRRHNRPLILLILLVFSCCLGRPQSVRASHKCPKPPKPPMISSSSFATTFLPAATISATIRSSGTSGCELGHPSKNFYTPQKRMIGNYLNKSLENVAEESAQGKGAHLQVLAKLIGCRPEVYPLFTQTLQKNYAHLFPLGAPIPSESQAYVVTEEVTLLVEDQPQLKQNCNYTSNG